MKLIFLLKTSFLLYVLCVIISCSKGTVVNLDNSLVPKTDSVGAKVFSGNIFLKDLVGTWVCYKFVKDESYTDEVKLFPESYAQEFSKYAYFDLYKDSITYQDLYEDCNTTTSYVLSGVGIYNTPIYAYNLSNELNRYDVENHFARFLVSDNDSIIFIKPYREYIYFVRKDALNEISSYPYYQDAPLNKMYLYSDNNMIMQDNGFFFFFKKEDNERRYLKNILGVPGDFRSFFRVKRQYENISDDQFLSKFIADFPFGGEMFMTKKNKKKITDNNWTENPQIKFIQPNIEGMYILKIEKRNDIFNYEYFSTDVYGDREDGEDEPQG